MNNKFKIIEPNKLTYNKALNRIEEISTLLENNALDLDKALKCYQEASELLQFCQEKITEVEKEIKKIQIIENKSDIKFDEE